MKFSLRSLGLLILIAFVVANVVLIFVNSTAAFYSPVLLAILNFDFQSIALFAVVYISARSYLKSGLLQLLLIGCGLIAFGIGVIINLARILIALNRDWNDFTVQMHTLGLFIFALLSFCAVILLMYKRPKHYLNQKKLKSNLAIGYSIMGILIVSLGLLALYNVIPEFFSPQGYTLLSTTVQTITVTLFVVSALLFSRIYLESKSKVLYWYSLGLAAIAFGIIVEIITPMLGTALFWEGQITEYAGSVFFLIAIWNAKGEARWTAAFTRSKVQFEYLFSNMMDGFAYHEIILNERDEPVDYLFLEFNDAFSEMMGVGREAIGKRVTEVIPGIEKDSSNWIGAFGEIAKTGKSVRFENYLQRLNKWYAISAYSPEKGYFAAIFEDITERKQILEKLESYSKHLEELVEERTKELKDSERLATIGQTAGAVGHDIRNPLQTITSELFLLKSCLDGLPDDEEKSSALESIGFIETQAEYINDIITDLQDFAKKLEPRKTNLNIPESIAQIIETVVISENIKVDVNIQADFPELMLDPTYFRRILTNLITNAVHAMPKGGKLTIQGNTKGSNAIISVEDTGTGIPDELKQKIFQPLFTTRIQRTRLWFTCNKTVS